MTTFGLITWIILAVGVLIAAVHLLYSDENIRGDGIKLPQFRIVPVVKGTPCFAIQELIPNRFSTGKGFEWAFVRNLKPSRMRDHNLCWEGVTFKTQDEAKDYIEMVFRLETEFQRRVKEKDEERKRFISQYPPVVMKIEDFVYEETPPSLRSED